MGGSLELKSEPGKGSIFSLFIPLEKKISAGPAASPPKSPLFTKDFAVQHPLSILAVDDNALNLRVIVSILQKLGYQALTACDGLEAVEIYKNSHPRCILMDLQMPVVNGIEATRQIREIEKNVVIPASYISALTANTVPEDRRLCFEAGMDFFLNKPLRIQNITEVLIEAYKTHWASGQ